MTDQRISDAQMLALVTNAARRSQYAAEVLARNGEGLVEVARLVAESLERGGKILVFGNGGSAACAQHFAAEFTGKLFQDRTPYPAISLTVDTSALTAIANDYGFDEVFARQVRAYGRSGDVAIGLSTSGASRNVTRAIDVAKSIGLVTVGLTGKTSELGADYGLPVDLRETARIQEVHDLMLHQVAQIAERLLVPSLADDASANRFPFVLGEDQLSTLRTWCSSSSQSLVTTNGAFDLIHEGHHASLYEARSLGDRLVVLLNSDESVRQLKGESRPIRTVHERIADLSRTPWVDHVVVMDDANPIRLLDLIRPDIHAKGSDYRATGLVEESTVIRNGGRIEYLEFVEGKSTSATESKIRQPRG